MQVKGFKYLLTAYAIYVTGAQAKVNTKGAQVKTCYHAMFQLPKINRLGYYISKGDLPLT